MTNLFQPKPHMKWWHDARFGMFIHWGIYSLAGRHEWVKNYEEISTEAYQKYFEHFNPDLYDPAEWAKAAKNAGMKYFVITTKHHDGFCLWDSKFTDYKVTNTPWGKDLIRPMVEAFRAEGIRVGFYYSLLDWHHPHFTVDRHHPQRNSSVAKTNNSQRDMTIYAEYMRNQLTELLTGFGKIDCLFLDYSYPEGEDGKGRDNWESEKLIKLIRNLQPEIVMNDRLDLMDNPAGWDYISPEQFKPRAWPLHNGRKVAWETCQTFSGSWGYYRDEQSWKSVNQLLTLLVETVSKGGNLLLNVGPTGRGNFDARAWQSLAEMGKWMKLHSRALYNCTEAPDVFIKPDNTLLTYNPELNRLYIHILNWPMGKIVFENSSDRIEYAQLLNDASEVQLSQHDGGPLRANTLPENATVLHLPIRKPEVEIPVIEIFLK